MRRILGWSGVPFAVALAYGVLAYAYVGVSAQDPSSTTPQPPSLLTSEPTLEHRALLNQYCVGCHNERLQTGGLALDAIDVDHVTENGRVWEKVLLKLATRQMPPSPMPRPDEATYDSFVAYLETELDRAAESNPNPGRPATVRRLNRTEYTNAVRDLLGLDIDGGALLPADDARFGFDNIADALSVSPVLLERYLSAAERISRLAVGDPAIPPTLETHEVPDARFEDSLMSEDLPFGSGGGVAIRHNFPLDAEYIITVGMEQIPPGRPNTGDILGFDEPQRLDVRLDGSIIKPFTVGGKSRGDVAFEVRIPVKAGVRLIGVSLARDSRLPEDVIARRGAEGGVRDVTIGGPYDIEGPGDTLSRRKIFVCHPTRRVDEEPCAKQIFSGLARLAYRRPVSEEDVQPLVELYRLGRSNGGFEAAIRTALEGLLVSPGFLLRVERDPEGVAPSTVYRVSDVELASRLSFFLWSSIPDDELLGVAERGELADREVLERQVRRMLADPRSTALVENFAGQWLHLRSVASKAVDRGTFPDFDENLREAFQRETELFFESIMREDRSVVDLLAADYTFLNERLARHYGIPNVRGPFHRRVTLTREDEHRKGLLGQGSLLMVTSYNTRTSPVLRGKWLLENVLGTPVPPPPPDAPSLREDADAKTVTMRELMTQHRANPACASCHNLMDPLGLALENFDAIGGWRTEVGDAVIDASGELVDGTKFDGPVGLRDVLLKRPEQFVRTFTERLLIYALGRGIAEYDRPAIRRILREAAPSDYRWSSLITGVVTSTPFQMRSSGES